MADKYHKTSSEGFSEEQEAAVTSAGAGNAGEIVALDAAGKLDNTLMPTGIGPETKIIEASENLAAGDYVNYYESTGLKCRKADASEIGKKADGFVLAAVTSGNNATVYTDGVNNQLSGLTAGSNYFLSDATPGAVTTTPPTTSAHIVQYIGKASAATEIPFEPGIPIKRA